MTVRGKEVAHLLMNAIRGTLYRRIWRSTWRRHGVIHTIADAKTRFNVKTEKKSVKRARRAQVGQRLKSGPSQEYRQCLRLHAAH